MTEKTAISADAKLGLPTVLITELYGFTHVKKSIPKLWNIPYKPNIKPVIIADLMRTRSSDDIDKSYWSMTKRHEASPWEVLS